MNRNERGGKPMHTVIPAKRPISAFTRVFDALWAARAGTHERSQCEQRGGSRLSFRSAGMTASYALAAAAKFLRGYPGGIRPTAPPAPGASARACW
jgi:hypothetical protein